VFLLIIVGFLLGIIIYQCLVIKRLRGSSYKINGGDPFSVPVDEENDSSQNTNLGNSVRNQSVNMMLPIDRSAKAKANKRVYQNDSLLELEKFS